MRYDKLIVGSGLYGATIAYLAKQRGEHCLVLERRKHVGGNVRDEWVDGINVHQYGAHIFHTNNAEVWNFMNKFTSFVPYVHTVMARNAGRIYHLPFNLNTFNEVFAIMSPDDAIRKLQEEHQQEYYPNPSNLEEKAVNLIGRTLYNLLVRDYTMKQWGRSAAELPADLINRLPIRNTFDNRYFEDQYQGIPKDGYSKMIQRMLVGIETRTGVDFIHDKDYWISQSKEVIYTGAVDELMDYQLGELGYRSLRFETDVLDIPNYQGLAVMNETGPDVTYTRTIEHKHFYYDSTSNHTIITKEYPQFWKRGLEPYYAINNEKNNHLYNAYRELVRNVYPTIRLGGRLGHYRYYDMDDVVEKALLFFLPMIEN